MADAVALQATNAQILDAIRNEAGLEYQRRIPSATQGDVASTIAALQGNRPHMNEFVDSLMNRIGHVVIQNRIWSNPLAQFKRGMMNYGDTIEEVYVNLLTANRFDPNASHEDVFKRSKPDVKTLFHSIDRQDQYPVTIEDKMLRRAFLDETGLQTLVGSVLQAPYNSDYYDEYLIMRNLLTEFAKNNQFYKVQIPDVLTSTSLEADTKGAIRLMKEYANRFKFMNNRYNASGVDTFTPEEDLVVFINANFDATIDVEVLAAAFNMSKAEYMGRRHLIDDFGIDGCMAILADRNIFMCADTLIEFTSIYNPKALGWNYWLNHHGIYSLSRFMNAVMFTVEAGTSASLETVTVSGVTVAIDDGTKTYAELGGELHLAATVTGATDPVGADIPIPQGVAWAITGANYPLGIGTYIDAEGTLHVDPHEPNKTLEISATTTYVNPDVALANQVAYVATIAIGIGGAADVAVPAVPVISAATPAGANGTGEAGAKLTLTNNTKGTKTTVTVAANGTWSSAAATVCGEAGDKLVAYQVDASGNKSAETAEFTVTAA